MTNSLIQFTLMSIAMMLLEFNSRILGHQNNFANASSLAEKWRLNHNAKEKTSFKFVLPELKMKYANLKINTLSIRTMISPEFINLHTHLGGIILHSAVENSNMNLIENLIDIKADLNIEDKEGITPLYKALQANNSDMIEMLKDAGADINFISDKGDTLLQTSIVRGDYHISKKLIEIGANVNNLNKDGVSALFKACETTNQQIINDLILKKANVNLKNSFGQSLLHIAVANGKLDVVKLLIHYGAEIDSFDNNCETPLYTALKLNYPGIIRILLDNGANPSSVSPKGNSLLHTAVLENRSDVIQSLIVIGANNSALDLNVLTPLCLAIKTNNIEVIKTMIANEIDPNLRCSGWKKEFPLHFAVSNGTIDAIKILVDGKARTSVLNENGLTPLILAIFEKKYSFIDLLNSKSSGVNYKTDRKGNTPLHVAVSKEDIESVENLLQLGAEIDIINGNGLTPLCTAVSTSSKKIIDLLKQKGANINFRTPSGDTPLHLAVINTKISIVIKLIELGAEVEYVNNKGLTPLCNAILLNATNIVNALLVKGANVTSNCNGESPYVLAVKNSTLPTLKRLINLGAKTEEDLFSLIQLAVKADNPEIMNFLLHKNNNDSKDWSNELLFLAASRGSTKITKELLNLKTPLEITTKNGFTPLWHALINDQINTLKVLLENGANLNKTVNYDNEGLQFSNWTLLHAAAFNGNVEILELLLKFGMSTEVKDGHEWAPLHYAAAQHNVEVIEKLIKYGANIQAKTNRGESPLDIVKHRRTYKPIIIEWLTTGKV